MPNQHFYDFQWRALNLCSEFYQAAEELIVSVMIISWIHDLQPALSRKVHLLSSSPSVTTQDLQRKSILLL